MPAKIQGTPAVGHAETIVGQHVRCPLVCVNKFQLKIIGGPIHVACGQIWQNRQECFWAFHCKYATTDVAYCADFLLFFIINKLGMFKQILVNA